MTINGSKHYALPAVLRALLLTGLVLASAALPARTFTDSAGRTVDIPDTVNRDFHELFYHVDLSDQELDTLIQWANGRTPQ